MDWITAFSPEQQPTLEQIDAFIHTEQWRALNRFLQETYSTAPTTQYSGCSGQPGWNVKYKKSGKSLCTLYPMDGFFIALVVVGQKEAHEAELLLPACTDYTQALYSKSGALMNARGLMMEVRDDAVLEDAKQLIQLRVKPKESWRKKA